MFALANSKELLNHAAMIICQKCVELKADLMTFASVKENKQNWYAFRFAKQRVGSYKYKNTVSRLCDMPSDFLQSWKEAAVECGKLFGNNGVAFFMFRVSWYDGRTEPMAIHSCPEDFDDLYSSSLEASWGRKFVKPLSNPVYFLGKELVPYELFHKPNYNIYDYSRHGDDPLNEIFYKVTSSADIRYRKADKKKLENLKTADPKKRQGYFLVANEKPETIPF